MRKKLMLLAALVVSTASVAVAGTALAAGTATKVTIQHQQGGFFGYVHSADQPCEAGRVVKLYKVTGDKPKPSDDKLIGKDTAQPNGPDSMWSINTSAKHGDFYAFARKVAAMQGAPDGCAKDRSRVVSL
jgi:hypothetical protein